MKSISQKIGAQTDLVRDSIRQNTEQLERIRQTVIATKRVEVADEVGAMRKSLLQAGIPAMETPILLAEYMRHLMADIRKMEYQS